VRPAKLHRVRMMKVRPAERDVERLKPHLKLVFAKDAALRWQSAAELDSASVEFRDKIARAIVSLLIGSIATSHRVRPSDRNEIENLRSRERKATRLIAQACQLYGQNEPRELGRALFGSIYRELETERAAAQLGRLQCGRPKYRAFAKFVRLVGEAYESASNKSAIVKVDSARADSEQYSGPFSKLLEEGRADAAVIWKRAGFNTSLDGPLGRNARLEFARKEMLTKHAEARSS